LSRYEQKNAFSLPRAVNLRRAAPLWTLLTAAGIPSVVIRCPCTYPPDEIMGKMLSGVGVPDLRGGLGTSTYYTTAAGVRAEHSEKVVQVALKDDTVQTVVVGPRKPRSKNDPNPGDFSMNITLRLDRAARKATILSDGQPAVLEVAEGQWSGWLKVKFKVGMLQSIRGMVRFYFPHLGSADANFFEFYASPVNFDPEGPMFPISHPVEYAQELEARLGSYYTSGMAEDHDGLNNDRFDEAAYLQQCEVVLTERQRMMRSELKRFKSGFFFTLFDTPDRLQHMLWRFRMPDHPANRHGRPWQPEWETAIEAHYRRLDGIVGEAMGYADDDTLFIALSDHGMNSFKRGLNLNTWLCEQGLLALKPPFTPGEEENGDFFHNVDWDKTRAYALGLGMIFLNQQGREERGVVAPAEAPTLKAKIASALTGLADPQNGQTAVRNVVKCEEVYRGQYVNEAPDLVVNFSEGYRVSWGTPLGGVPAGLFEDNTKRWAGDHVIDPALVPGVLFMNRAFKPGASLLDLAPTILNALGVPKRAAMEGENLLP
jgi:predicted AlkP superfamily phosphohydrolase/phosphomutase